MHNKAGQTKFKIQVTIRKNGNLCQQFSILNNYRYEKKSKETKYRSLF